MVARINTVAFHGVEVQAVDVQVQISNGLPVFTNVGYNILSFLMIIFLAFAGLVPNEARADWGTRMLAFKCDGPKNEVILQPFIQWNENYIYQGLQLDLLHEKSPQFVAGYSFFSPKSFEETILKITCGIQSRSIKLFLDSGVLTIVDIKGKESWAKEIVFSTEIGSAWDVYGPLYQIKSNQFNQWQECKSRGDVASTNIKYTCTPINSGE